MPTAAPRPEETEAPGAPEEPPEDEAPGPVPQHSGVKPDGTLSRATLLMGDSLTAGLATSMLVHGTLGEARYIGIPSYSLQSFYSAPYYVDYDAAVAAGQLAVCSHEFKGMSLAQAAQTAGTSVEALYFMLGTNMSDAVTVENYTGTLRYLLNCCPDATLYAQWSKGSAPATTVTITFDGNADDAKGTMNPMQVEKGESVTLTANAFTRDGYFFTGWNTKPDGSGTSPRDSAKVKASSDVTLYAQWSDQGEVQTPNPGVTTSVGGQYAARNTDIGFTVTQEVPSDATRARAVQISLFDF